MRYLMLLLLFIPLSVHAQEAEASPWYYFAQHRDTGVVVAYTIDGDVREVPSSDILSRHSQAFRVDAQTLLVVDLDQNMLAHLTPDGLVPILELEQELIGAAYHYPYLALVPFIPSSQPVPVLLVNVEAGVATYLDRTVPNQGFFCCRISADGTALRYMSLVVDSNNNDIGYYELRERDLASGVERVVYSLTNDHSQNSVLFLPDTDGSWWLQREVQQQGQIHVESSVTMTGEVDVFNRFAPGEDQARISRMWDDYLVMSDPSCDSDCTLEIRLATGGAASTFLFDGSPIDFHPVYLNQGDSQQAESHLYGLNASSRPLEFVRLSENRDPEIIGYIDSDNNVAPFRSPDGRWVTVTDSADAPISFALWDNQRGEFAMRVTIPDGQQVFVASQFGEALIVLTQLRQPLAHHLYLTGSDQIITVGAQDGGSYRIFRPDLTAIYQQVRDGDREPGVYRFDISNGQFTRLLPGDYLTLPESPIELWRR